MKKVINIFNWLTVVICILIIIFVIVFSIFLGLSQGKNGNSLASIFAIISFVFFCIPLLIPISVCIISNYQLKKAKERNEIKIMGIITLLFGNIVSGILMLCLEDKDFNKE